MMVMTNPKHVRHLLGHMGSIVLIKHGEVTADDKGNKLTFPVLSQSPS